MLHNLLRSLRPKPASPRGTAGSDAFSPALLAKVTPETPPEILYDQNQSLRVLFNFTMQFFAEIRKLEKQRLRGSDRERLERIRSGNAYRGAFTNLRPLVSVIIPTFNRADIVIERTLPSIFAQSHDNWEVIVVGDGMSEADAAPLSRFRHPGVRFINLKRRGRYPEAKGPRWYCAGTKAVNFGLRIAQGQWMAHLDDDDEFLPDHLERLLQLAQSGGVEWAHGKVRFIGEDRGKELQVVVGEPVPRLGGIARISSLYHGCLKTFRYNVNCWKYYYPGDWDLWERFLDMGVTHAHLDRVTAVHHGNFGRIADL